MWNVFGFQKLGNKLDLKRSGANLTQKIVSRENKSIIIWDSI